MNTTGNTILITGGSAGIGLAMAKSFVQLGNTVIITGRNQQRLDEAALELPGIVTIKSDVSDEDETKALVERISHEFPQLNMVINNAGTAFAYKLGLEESAYNNAVTEMDTNYLSVIRLNDLLLPLLSKNNNAAIVHVTSIAAYLPAGAIPTYAASKAALHFYTQSLREALEGTVQVYEVMPPLVNTQFSQAIGGAASIPPEEVALELILAMEKDQLDVPVGNTKKVHQVFSDALTAIKG